MGSKKEGHEPFSVAISVYRRDDPLYLERALESITREQTVLPDEIVLVVDGPVGDGLDAVIRKYEKAYDMVQVIRLEKNGGLGNALRIAVAHSKNELIARMDSDDVSAPDRFEQQLKFMENNPEVDIVGGDITEFAEQENKIVARRMVPSANAEIREDMKVRCAMNHVTVMYRKGAVQRAGGYQDWFCNEDYYLWIRMWLNDAKFANTGTVLVNVRVGQEMYRRRGGWRYYRSEKGLQEYMLQKKMIGYGTYCRNVCKRLVVQVLLPNRVRGWVFRRFARQ